METLELFTWIVKTFFTELKNFVRPHVKLIKIDIFKLLIQALVFSSVEVLIEPLCDIDIISARHQRWRQHQIIQIITHL